MDFKPLHDQLERLNSNLETWIGLVSVLNSKATPEVATAPAAPAPAAEAEPAAETESKGRGRPRKRYFYNSTKQWVQETGTSPGAEWVEVTKTKYEEIRDKISKGELKPAAETPAAAAPPSDDPFADDAPTSPQKDLTLEEVRAVAFQVRDKFGMDRAKTIIAKFAPKLDQIKVEDYSRFVAECNSALGDGDL